MEEIKRNATDASIIGPGWWWVGRLVASYADSNHALRTGSQYQSLFIFWVEYTKEYFKALDCKGHFEIFYAKNPLKPEHYFEWTVKAQNEVNARNGKKQFSIEDAMKKMKQIQKGLESNKLLPGFWAFIHQTALYYIKEDNDNIIPYHQFLSKQTAFGSCYKLPKSAEGNDLFEWTIKEHMRYGGLPQLSVDQAEEIWGPDNVKEEPCNGGDENPEKQDTYTTYDVEYSDEESDSEEKQKPSTYSFIANIFNPFIRQR